VESRFHCVRQRAERRETRVNLPGQEEQAALVMGGKPSPFGMDCELLRRCTPLPPSVRLRGLHAHLASGVGADGLLAAAGRLVSFGRQWCAGHGVTEPEFNLGGPVTVGLAAAAIDAYQRGSVVVDRYRGRAGQPRADQEAEYARLAESGALSLA
jgi:diaminopimelate decarboxylase